MLVLDPLPLRYTGKGHLNCQPLLVMFSLASGQLLSQLAWEPCSYSGNGSSCSLLHLAWCLTYSSSLFSLEFLKFWS